MLLSDRDVEIWSSPCLEVGEQPGICLCLIRELHEILIEMAGVFADIADLLCVWWGYLLPRSGTFECEGFGSSPSCDGARSRAIQGSRVKVSVRARAATHPWERSTTCHSRQGKEA